MEKKLTKQILDKEIEECEYHNKKFEEIISQKQLLNVMTLKDYDKFKGKKDWIIKNRKYLNQREVRFGDTASFKSLFSFYEGLCIASGKKLFGKYNIKKCGVLYVSAENSVEQDKNVLQMLRKGMGLRKKNISFYVLPATETKDVLDFGFKESIFDFVEENNIKVVYLDTINPLALSIDDNSSREVTKLFKEFLDVLALKHGCNVTIIMHTDKARKNFLGSTKWKCNSDSTFRIEREMISKTPTNFFKIYNEKNRKGEKPVLEGGISFSERNIRFNFMKEGGVECFNHKKKPTKEENLLSKLNELVKDKALETNEIKKIFDKNKIIYAKSTFHRIVKKWRENE